MFSAPLALNNTLPEKKIDLHVEIINRNCPILFTWTHCNQCKCW